MILSAQSIRKRTGMITPFCERTTLYGLTFGLGPAGYDVRVEFDRRGCVARKVLHPGDFVLASTIERFKLPPDLLARVCDKSSWARHGLAVQNTVLEPGWEGWLTLELTNHSGESLTLLRGAPIAQVIFEQLDEPTEISYAGKYQDQDRGPQVAR